MIHITPEASVIVCDAISALGAMESGSVACCVTSPPYWGLRDYGHGDQIGRERRVCDYVTTMVAVFREVRRVLADSGTLWLNLGDSYAGGQLAGVPWMVALALRDDGWILRSDLIWSKPSPMPESVKNRCTKSHEYVFMFDGAAIGQAYKRPETATDTVGVCAESAARDGRNDGGRKRADFYARGWRNRGTVWEFAGECYQGAHGAVMPSRLAERCILAGSPPGSIVLDPFAGSGTTLAVAQRLGRRSVGIELNPAYIELVRKRIICECAK